MLKGLSIMFLSYIFTSGLLAAQAQTTVVAESFNLRYDTPNDGINAWPKRQHMVLTHLQTLLPDVVGMQEVLAHQLEWLDHNLPDYAYIGVGRDDGLSKGEFVPLLYNKNQLTKVAGGNFWLSETPAVAGSIGWQAQLPRVVSWGHFKKNDKEFFVFNAHFSHVSDLARLLLIDQVQAIPGSGQIWLEFLVADRPVGQWHPFAFREIDPIEGCRFARPSL